MKSISRNLGLAMLFAVVLLGSRGMVLGQPEQDIPPLPSLPPVEQPEQPQETLPKLPIVEQEQIPAVPVPEEPAGEPEDIIQMKGSRPTPDGEAGPEQISIKDIILGITQGPTPANPTGRQEPGVSMEWLYPSIVQLGQQTTCTLVVRSISINRLHHVSVRVHIPAGAQIKGTEPEATREDGILIWHLGDMEPRQEKRLDLHLVPTVKGSLPCYGFVTFTGSSMAKLEVREPKLAIKADAPKSVIKGDVAIVALTVSNPGDANSEHVKVKVHLTEGLEYGSGKGTEVFLDTLGPNESRTVLLQCAAKAAGTQVCTVTATGEPGLNASTSSPIEVIEPRIDVAVTGPQMRYLDRHGLFTFKVTNPGTATANHVTLTNQVPVGFKVVGATKGAYHDFATRTVVWFLGDVKAGESKEVSLKLLAINPGEHTNKVSVTASRGLRSNSDIFTRVEGLPGLLMELVDVEDPVEVGKDASYEIRLTNTGTKTETNLQVICTLPEKMEFRGAKSSAGTEFRVEGRTVVFSPIPRLAPRADVILRVTTRCLAPGDLRFQARVTADGLESPVLREESTRVFGDDREGALFAPEIR